MPRWPAKALAALATLFRELQDLDVYVEDTNDEVFYLEVLSRVAPNGVRIARVFGLTGRASVLQQCAQHDFRARAALFLIDGDFPFVRGVEETLPDGTLRIPAYCVENLLLCPAAAVEILFEGAGGEPRESLSARLNWTEWIEQEIRPLIELFVWFAVSSALTPGEPTVSCGVGRILSQSGREIPQRVDATKVKALRDEVEAHVRQSNSAEDVHATEASVCGRIQIVSDPLDIVSGKDFVLPLLHLRIRSLVKQSITRASLRIRLAKHCSLRRWQPIALALEDAARGRTPDPMPTPA